MQIQYFGAAADNAPVGEPHIFVGHPAGDPQQAMRVAAEFGDALKAPQQLVQSADQTAQRLLETEPLATRITASEGLSRPIARKSALDPQPIVGCVGATSRS